MGRNYEKYVYAELSIPRNSAWYPLLLAEAEAKGLPLAQVALERLAATYLSANQTLNSVVVTPVPATSRQLVPLSPLSQAPKSPAIEAPDEEEEDDLELNEQRAARNADAFLEANGGGFF